MERINRKFTPNSNIVCVKHKTYGNKYYEVFNIDGYLKKCMDDGKIAYYVGKANINGELIIK